MAGVPNSHKLEQQIDAALADTEDCILEEDFMAIDADLPCFGCPNSHNEIPQYLKQHPAIISLLWDRNGHRYSDYNCLFRAIVLGRSHVVSKTSIPFDLERQTQVLLKEFLNNGGRKKFHQANEDSFYGVPFKDLAIVEKLFGVEFTVYTWDSPTGGGHRGDKQRRKSSVSEFLDLEADEDSFLDDHSEVDFDDLAEACGEDVRSDTDSVCSDDYENLEDSFIEDEETETSSYAPPSPQGGSENYATIHPDREMDSDVVDPAQLDRPADEKEVDGSPNTLTESRFLLARLPTTQSPRGTPIDIVWSHNHALYVTSIKKLCGHFGCRQCGAVFTDVKNLKRHVKTGVCQRPTRKVYTKHGYEPGPTLFEALNRCFPTQILLEGEDSLQHPALSPPRLDAITITRQMRFPCDIVCYDIETYAQKPDTTRRSTMETTKTEVLDTQVPYYIGVSWQLDEYTINPDSVLKSDFPDTEARYAAFTSRDVGKMTDQFVDKLSEIQQEFEKARRIRYRPLLKFVKQQLESSKEAYDRLSKPEQGAKGFKYYKQLKLAAEELLVEKASLLKQVHPNQDRLNQLAKQIDKITVEFKAAIVELGPKAVLAGKRDQIKWLHSKLEKFVTVVPVIGYNSGRFDLNCLKQYLFSAIQRKGLLCLKDTQIIQRGTQYLLLSVGPFNFFDITNFLAPGNSYEKFVKSMDVGLAKSVFPHSLVTSYDDLLIHRSMFPAKGCFRSNLHGDQDIDQTVYEATKCVWESRGFNCLLDLVEHYLKFDCVPLVTATRKYVQLWQSFDISIFYDGIITLPGLAMRELFKRKEVTAHFAGIPEKFSWFVEDLFKGIVGGPSCIFNRLQIVDETKVRPDGNPTAAILGYDANALYLHCLALGMPIGTPIHIHPTEDAPDPYLSVCRGVRYHPNGARPEELPEHIEKEDLKRLHDARRVHEKTAFKREEVIPFARNEGIYGDMLYTRFKEEVTQKLEAVGVSDPVRIPKVRHILTGKQKSLLNITGSRVYCDAAIGDYVFGELNGCKYHFHDCQDGRAAFRNADLETAKAMVKSRWWTDVKQYFLQTVALQYATCMYECGFKNEKRTPESHTNLTAAAHDPDGSIGQTLASTNRIQSGRTLEKRIRNGELHGFVKCSVMIHHCDGTQRRRLTQLPPIFKNFKVSSNNFDIPSRREQMREIMEKPRRVLVPSYYAEEKLFHTGYLSELLTKYDAVITKIYYVIQYAEAKCFEQMMTAVWNGRAQATEQNDPLRGTAFKLIGNSCYGKSITAIDKQRNVKLATNETVSKMVNSRGFLSQIPIDDDFYEVHMNKHRLVYKLPCVIGCTVYNWAKVILLRFCYDFLDYYVDREDYTLTSCDTDSLYFALATKTLEEAVERRAQRTGNPQLLKDFNDPHCPHGKAAFLVSETAGVKDRLRPGLFKLEWSGTHYIGLQPKVGLMQERDNNVVKKQKAVIRGCKQQQNSDKVDWDVWRNVLQTNGSVEIQNTNFRARNGGVEKVKETRDCIGSYLVKAVVDDDDVTVLPFVNDFTDTQPDQVQPERTDTPDSVVDRRLQAVLTEMEQHLADENVNNEGSVNSAGDETTQHMCFDVRKPMIDDVSDGENTSPPPPKRSKLSTESST